MSDDLISLLSHNYASTSTGVKGKLLPNERREREKTPNRQCAGAEVEENLINHETSSLAHGINASVKYSTFMRKILSPPPPHREDFRFIRSAQKA
jgi:hypothetical protein